jgi:hypothetical protein
MRQGDLSAYKDDGSGTRTAELGVWDAVRQTLRCVPSSRLGHVHSQAPVLSSTPSPRADSRCIAHYNAPRILARTLARIGADSSQLRDNSRHRPQMLRHALVAHRPADRAIPTTVCQGERLMDAAVVRLLAAVEGGSNSRAAVGNIPNSRVEFCDCRGCWRLMTQQLRQPRG